MGIVYNAFKRNRAQLYKARTLKEREQSTQPVFIARPIKSIGRFYGKLPLVQQVEAKQLRYKAGRVSSAFLQAEYHRLERISRYANFQ